MSGSPVRTEGLQVTGLAKCYATTPVFEDVQIELPRGRTLAVLGASGCGKTTLLRVIAGLEAADAGRVRLGGRDIGQLSPQKYRDLIELIYVHDLGGARLERFAGLIVPFQNDHEAIAPHRDALYAFLPRRQDCRIRRLGPLDRCRLGGSPGQQLLVG